jgi:hypothetical protein
MKNQYTLTNAIRRSAQFGLAVAGLMLLAITASAAPVEVRSPSAPSYGYSYAEWSAKWWQWSLGQNANHLELVGNPGICSGEGSAVRFLAGAAFLPETGGASAVTNKITIEPKTPLFLTIISAWDDNSACPTFTSYTAAELMDTNAANWAYVSETTCTIDGVAVPGLSNPATTEYLTVSPAFSYTTATQDNMLAILFGDSCVPGDLTIYPAVAQGVYLMIEPLPPGKHVIHTVGEVGNPPFVIEDSTFDITVNPE